MTALATSVVPARNRYSHKHEWKSRRFFICEILREKKKCSYIKVFEWAS